VVESQGSLLGVDGSVTEVWCLICLFNRTAAGRMSPQLFIWVITSFVHTRELLFCNESCSLAAPKYTSPPDAYVDTIRCFRVRLSEEYLQKSPHRVVVTYVLFCRLLPKSGLPTDWRMTDWRKTKSWLPKDEWLLVFPGFSISSNFQKKSDGSYWLEC